MNFIYYDKNVCLCVYVMNKEDEGNKQTNNQKL